MSEYAGEVYVKVVPDARGFTPDLDRQLASQSPRVRALLSRTGLDKTLKGYDRASRDLIATQNELATAESIAATQTEKLGKAHEQVAIHAHRSQIAGFTIRGTTLGLGAAAVVGAEGLRKLSEALKVTGDAAESTTGRLRNAGAAALSGDFATAAQRLGEAAALTLSPGARTAQDAAAAATKTDKQRQDAIALATTILDLREKVAKAEGTVGTAAGVTTFQYEKQLKAATAAYRALAPNLQRVAAGQFGLAPDLGNRVRVAPTDTSRASGFELGALRAAQTKQTADDRRLFEDRREFLAGQIRFLETAGAHTQAAKDRLKTLYGQLDAVEGQIQTLDDEARARRQARLQTRLALQAIDLQIAQANARSESETNAALANEAATARANAQNKNLDLQTRKGYELQAAQADRTIFENEKAAADRAKAERERAAAERKRLAEEAKRKREQEIAEEKRRRQEAAQQYRADISLAEQKINLGVQRAQLTEKNLKDDRAAIKRQIRFYREQERDFKLTDAERLNFRSQRIGAQLSLQGLSRPANVAPRSSASDFFSEAASQFRSFGSNISTAGGILSGQDARAAFAARALSSGNIAAVREQQAQRTRTNLLTEAQKQTALLTTIAGRLTYGGAERDPPAKAIGSARRGAHVVQAAV